MILYVTGLLLSCLSCLLIGFRWGSIAMFKRLWFDVNESHKLLSLALDELKQLEVLFKKLEEERKGHVRDIDPSKVHTP